MRKSQVLPEYIELQSLIEAGGADLQAEVLGVVEVGERRFDLTAVSLGTRDPQAPAIGYFGGVHGLERIGAEVVLAYLGSLVARLRWDEILVQQLRQLRMVFLPLVNPGGLWLGTRANPQGVDLMRNSPVESSEKVPCFLGGQRIGPELPWYRGARHQPMQVESQALCHLVERELLGRRFSLAIDCHSGFGLHDRVWFPFAHTRRPPAHLPEIHALHDIFEQSHAHHTYVFEPQSRQYLTHGDLWDHLYLKSEAEPAQAFIPLTLEMGSWLWVKKNPRQLFSRQGIFNPLIAHRQRRVMRRHLPLLDFFARAAVSHARWRPEGVERERRRAAAIARWYGGAA